jgi:hypothetical protein
MNILQIPVDFIKIIFNIYYKHGSLITVPKRHSQEISRAANSSA